MDRLKIIILASKGQERTIQFVKSLYENPSAYIVLPNLDYKNIPIQEEEEWIHMIQESDKVVAIMNPDGTFGDKVAVEVAVAEFFNKPITIIKV